jgi:hypothetical protein
MRFACVMGSHLPVRYDRSCGVGVRDRRRASRLTCGSPTIHPGPGTWHLGSSPVIHPGRWNGQDDLPIMPSSTRGRNRMNALLKVS